MKVSNSIFFVIFFLFVSDSLFGATKKAKTIIDIVQFDPLVKEEFIRSKIDFSWNNQSHTIHVADISVQDAITSCPLDTLPVELATAVQELVSKVHSSLSKIKDLQGDRCSSLDQALETSASQVGNAYQYQLVAAGGIPSNANQDQINQQIQKANAINQMIMTTSNMLKSSCISVIDDRQVIQKLIAQIVTLSGLFVGGWQGIAIATGGQVIGALPLFVSDIDASLTLFQKYEESNERGSFLCFFRQLKKTSCLLFGDESDRYINGLDITFKTGPVATTLESVKKLELEAPAAVRDLTLLEQINAQSEGFLAAIAQLDSVIQNKNLPEAASKAFEKPLDELLVFCKEVNIHSLEDPRIIQENIQKDLSHLSVICEELKRFELKATPHESYDALTAVSWDLYWTNTYYQSVKKNEASEIGKMAKTLESMKYFEDFKKSIAQYRDTQSGNQSRMNFRDLTKKLGNILVRPTFKGLFKGNFDKYSQHGHGYPGFNFNKKWQEPTEDNRIRKRALLAMIDLCQTFDPTLSCLDVGSPEADRLFKTWKRHCVGPQSFLCKETLERGETDLFLKEKKYRIYFDSICGRDASWFK